MNRREFLKSAAVVALAAGFWDRLPLGAAPAAGGAGEVFDLVAVRNREPVALLDEALEALGGIGRFVKSGQSVVIKPNIGWNQTPESGADTNPELIGALTERCLGAGASRVVVFDHTCDRDWEACYQRSGIRAAVEKAGGEIVTGNNHDTYVSCPQAAAVRMKNPEVMKLVRECDVFINVPVLKNHGGAKMTCAMKNFMGVVWDRPYMHKNDLDQCIADSVLVRRPDLNIVDAYRVMLSGGPVGRSRATRSRLDKMLLASTDIVAVDTAAARILGLSTDDLKYLGYGEALGLGSTDLNSLRIKRIG